MKRAQSIAAVACISTVCYLSPGIVAPVAAQVSVIPWGEAGYNWTGDFNGDGRTDLASAHPGGGVTMRLSNGSEFKAASWSISTPWGGAEYTWAEDFNGDGKTDLISALENNVYVHLSDGSQFTTLAIDLPNRWGEGGYNWAGDFNGDGQVDFASAHPDGTVTMRFSTEAGFDVTTWLVSTPWGGAQYTWAEDFNGDSKTDLISALENNIYVHLSDGSQFETLIFETPNLWGEPGYNWAGDFNNDGKMDFASAQFPSGNAVVRLSTGQSLDITTWTTVHQTRRID